VCGFLHHLLNAPKRHFLNPLQPMSEAFESALFDAMDAGNADSHVFGDGR
jgi:hypothetical protein